jgi:hypothetical protein
MPTPWEDAIKKTKRLTVFAASGVTGGIWKSVFPNAIAEFNKLSAAQSLGVTLTVATAPPDPNGSGGADVQFQTASGKATFTSFGQPFSLTVNGDAVHGHTQIIKTVFGTVERVAKAFIFVPSTPRSGAKGSRVVGDGVKLLIAVHELVHACGLSNADHSALSDPDLFIGIPSLSSGSNPADDKVDVGNQTLMPPLALSSATAGVIKQNWS